MLAFGAHLDGVHVSTEGIDTVEAIDSAFAERFGFVVKQLGIAKLKGDGPDAPLELRVHPALVAKDAPIANINGVLNAVAIEGRALGPCLLSGRGAGDMPTAVSVVADIVDVAIAKKSGVSGNMTRAIRLGESPITMSHGGPAIAALLARWPDTEAVMCVSDMSAFGAIMECQRRGLNVPGDIAIAGFGNFEVANCCHPTITTVSVDAYGIGERTGQTLLAALAAREQDDASAPVASKHVKIDYAVVPRESA